MRANERLGAVEVGIHHPHDRIKRAVAGDYWRTCAQEPSVESCGKDVAGACYKEELGDPFPNFVAELLKASRYGIPS